MTARARTCVALDPRSSTPRSMVVAPHECDAPMQRDGITTAPPPGRGECVRRLRQQPVESAPPAIRRGQLGGRSATQIMALPVTDSWDPDLHGSWCRAAVRQRTPSGRGPSSGLRVPHRRMYRAIRRGC